MIVTIANAKGGVATAVKAATATRSPFPLRASARFLSLKTIGFPPVRFLFPTGLKAGGRSPENSGHKPLEPHFGRSSLDIFSDQLREILTTRKGNA